MWQTKRKLFVFVLSLVFVLFHSQQAFAQEDTSDLEYWNEIAQELTVPTPNLLTPLPDLKVNLQPELLNVTTTSSDLEQSSLDLMDAWEMFDLCEQKVNSLELRCQTLSSYSKSLEDVIQPLTIEVSSLKNDLKNTRNALQSNKGDTHNALALAGEFYEQVKALEERVAYAERKSRNNYIYGNVVTPIPGLLLMTYGLIEMGKGNTDNGWAFVTAGGVALLGMELIYQGGKWVFKIF